MIKINIVGNIFGTSGYDSHTRQLANALGELGADVRLDCPKPPQWERYVNDFELNALTKSFNKDYITIGIVTPPFGRLLLGDNPKKYIQYVIWEGDSIPKYWLEYLLDERVDQIWVPSQHTKDAIEKTWDERGGIKHHRVKPDFFSKIKIVPHGVDLNIFNRNNLDFPRSDKFTFVCNKGWRGGFDDRGGVAYVLKAYCEEFKKNEKVSLLLKLNPSYLNIQQLNQKMEELDLPKYRPDIRINIDNIPLKNLSEIYCQGDVYVCAQRADAFDLGSAEAMACGLPVIVSEFGGQIEHTTEKNSLKIKGKLEYVKGDVQYESIKWLTPDTNDIRKKMRWAFNNGEKIKDMGVDAQKFISENFKWRMSATKALKFLDELDQ